MLMIELLSALIGKLPVKCKHNCTLYGIFFDDIGIHGCVYIHEYCPGLAKGEYRRADNVSTSIAIEHGHGTNNSFSRRKKTRIFQRFKLNKKHHSLSKLTFDFVPIPSIDFRVCDYRDLTVSRASGIVISRHLDITPYGDGTRPQTIDVLRRDFLRRLFFV